MLGGAITFKSENTREDKHFLSKNYNQGGLTLLL